MNMKRTLLSSMAVLNREGGVLHLLVLVCLLLNVRETSYFWSHVARDILRQANSLWRPRAPSPMKLSPDNLNKNSEHQFKRAFLSQAYQLIDGVHRKEAEGRHICSCTLLRNKLWRLTVELTYCFKLRPLYPPGDHGTHCLGDRDSLDTSWNFGHNLRKLTLEDFVGLC
jgi:hypothetical protein